MEAAEVDAGTDSPASCGACSTSCLQGTCTGYDVCGDNNAIGQCGHTCMEQGWENFCANENPALPFQTTWTVSGVCMSSGQPYRLDAGAIEFREGGLAGCQYETNIGNGAWCCP